MRMMHSYPRLMRWIAAASRILDHLAETSAQAISNIKFDKITVWDSGGDNQNGTTTANFLSGFVKSLPPLHDIAEMAGLDLPKYLGGMTPPEAKDDEKKVGTVRPAPKTDHKG